MTPNLRFLQRAGSPRNKWDVHTHTLLKQNGGKKTAGADQSIRHGVYNNSFRRVCRCKYVCVWVFRYQTRPGRGTTKQRKTTARTGREWDSPFFSNPAERMYRSWRNPIWGVWKEQKRQQSNSPFLRTYCNVLTTQRLLLPMAPRRNCSSL